MQLTNSRTEYGMVSITLHWVMALLIVGLFGLGLYMTSLSYYDPWYKSAPDLHRSIGVVVLLLLTLRLGWRLLTPIPEPESGIRPWEHAVAHLVHMVIYPLIALIGVTGYLITTADGRGLPVFGWFDIPAIGPFVERQEDLAGALHLALAVTLIILVLLHAAAALKHHFIDRDRTLLRMLGSSGTPSSNNPHQEI